MKETNKRIILLLSVFTIFLLSLSIVSATDNSTSNNTNQSQSTAVDNTNQNILEQSGNSTYLEGDVHVTNNNISDLTNTINSSNNTVIFFDNQTFDIIGGIGNEGIRITNKTLTFYGGHSFGDGQTSTIISTKNIYAHDSFRVFSSNITFIGFNFDSNMTDINSYNSSRLYLINCTFNNLTDSISIESDSANRYCLITDNCIFKNCTLGLFKNASVLINNSKFDNASIEVRNKNHYLNITNSEFYNNNNILDDRMYPIKMDSDCYNVTCNIDKCKFYNNKQASIVCTLSNNTVNITNSIFNNNHNSESGEAIKIEQGKLYLENTTFINNSAPEFGGAIYTANEITAINNCSFYNNSALYGGAIYTLFKNLTINNSKFDGNNAIVAGGAISFEGNNTLINNSVFNNNSANVCGGAIVIGNSSQNTISNSNFSNNNASGYGDDIYYFYGNISLNNNRISNIYNGKNNIISIYGQDISEGFVIHLNNNTTGFCLEIELPYPSYNIGDIFSIFNNTNLVINTLNYEKVGDYIKYMIYNYYGKVPNKALNIAIWILTNYNYTDSDFINEQNYTTIELEAYNKLGGSVGISRYALNLLGDPYENNYTIAKDIVIDTINAYNQGVRIPDHFVTVNEDGSGTLYDFGSIFSNVYQNFITFKTSNYTVVYDMNVTKITNTPVVYKGEDTSFDIIVSNNGTMTLNNVSIIEDSYDDLTYKSWTSTDNWTYSFVNNKHTWTLNNPLLVNQSARITVIFSTNNSTVGDKINTVIATSNNTDNKTANNTTEVIENNTTNPNNPENNTPNKPTTTNPDNHSNITPKEAVKTNPDTGYPIIVLIIALIAILASGIRKK